MEILVWLLSAILQIIMCFIALTLCGTLILVCGGEYEFKNYRLKISDYIYTFLVMIIFLISGLVENAILGMFIYCLSVVILAIVLEKNSLLHIINEIKGEINRWRKQQSENQI